ncbi:hypothetical protein [Oryza sativa Japonica Group]|uniref:Uncharacterized protein n=1 Tax=Oryza sativa subsp. japonica TaxID=39947 RepID=Q5SNE2_ORYSJ|nr:hypothetical protein [Oryza sativa Japonica Group]BAD72260.1 hypothetical protein [Oryza sativa Japonica Group]
MGRRWRLGFSPPAQTKHVRVFSSGTDHQLLRSLVNPGEEVILTVPNEQLEHVVRFLLVTRITRIMTSDDVLVRSLGNAYFLVPTMVNLHPTLAAARLDGRVKTSSADDHSSLSEMLLPRAAAIAAHEKVGQNILCADVASKVSSTCAKTIAKTTLGGKVSGIDS